MKSLSPPTLSASLKSRDPLFRSDAVVEWAVSEGRTDYEAACQAMERRARDIFDGAARERIWLVEHPPLFTAGTSARPDELRDPSRFPVHRSARGGRYTYHGPGQRVAYVMLNLGDRGRDIRQFVDRIEDWIIEAVASFGVIGEKRADRVGVWVRRTAPDGTLREDKIAAIGVRVRRWVSFHGIALNVRPDLEHFSGISPCGIDDPRYGVTSLEALGVDATMDDVDGALLDAFRRLFGPTVRTKG